MRVVLSYILAAAVGALAPIAAVLGFVGLAGLSAARDQCPNGSDCHDAMTAVWMGAVAIALLAAAIWGLVAIRRR
jgi:hypothetical protein